MDSVRRSCEIFSLKSGFTPGRSTIDRIVTLNTVIQCRKEFQRPIWIAFVDLKAAFDSVDRKCSHAFNKLPKTVNNFAASDEMHTSEPPLHCQLCCNDLLRNDSSVSMTID